MTGSAGCERYEGEKGVIGGKKPPRVTTLQYLADIPAGTLIPGQLVRASISSVTASGRVLQLSLNPQTAVKGQLNEVSSVSSILPGHLVSTLITAVMPSGLNVKIGGFFDGTIDLTHLALGDAEIEDRYKVGKKVCSSPNTPDRAVRG